MAEHWFIVPPIEGPPSGGTVYNRELLRELASAGQAIGVLDPLAARDALAAGAAGVYWVDSLFLEHFPALTLANHQRRALGLVAHYLPSLVEQSDAATPQSLGSDERFALSHADVVLAPSEFMRRSLVRLGLAERACCLVVEPGCMAPGVPAEPAPLDGVRALLIANLTRGKGVEPLLRALALELRESDAFQLEIVGRLDVDASYARSCRARVEQQPELARRVTFAGSLSPAQVAERLLSSNLLISASRMESFGMAIAEARTVGVPIAALARGNVRDLVQHESGGALASSDAELAQACLGLARDRGAHARALRLARAHPRPPRSFADAARDFETQVSAIGFGLRA
jgi:glycosyltransferase involved in cell wall biosynthesis